MWTDLQKAEQLASIKTQIKVLEAEAKVIQEQMIAEDAEDKIKTSFGTLTLTTRVAVDLIDKGRLFGMIGVESYLLVSSVAFGAVKKQLGESVAAWLKNDGCFEEGKSSRFYTLK